MLCPRYDESSCQSYELLYHLIGPEKNVKSLKDSGWSPFLSKISSVFEVLLPMIPIQTLIRRLATKANISYYCWTLITSNQGWIEVLRMKKEGEKYRETQVSRTGATCLMCLQKDTGISTWFFLEYPVNAHFRCGILCWPLLISRTNQGTCF